MPEDRHAEYREASEARFLEYLLKLAAMTSRVRLQLSPDEALEIELASRRAA